MERHLAKLACLTWFLGVAACSSYAGGLGDLFHHDVPQPKKVARPAPPSPLSTYTGPKKRVAVMDVAVDVTATQATAPNAYGGTTTTQAVSVPPPTDFGTGLTEMLTTALVNSGRFIVLERKALADIQAEQQLGASGAVSHDSAAKTGKLLGAQALVRGAVTEYTYTQSSTSGSGLIAGIGLAKNKVQASVVIDVRLYDTTTGQVLDSQKAEGHASASATSVSVNRQDVQLSGSGFQSTPLGEASRQAIEKAVSFIIARMQKIPWEGRIADVEAGDNGGPPTLYLNAGSSSGLRVGDQFNILEPGKPITDPETKVIIGHTKDKHIGACRVTSLMKNVALAAPTDGTGFKVGDVIRFVSPPPAAGGKTPARTAQVR